MVKSAVILTIKDAANMSVQGRKEIVVWLKRQADFLSKYNKSLSSRYIVRYLYDTEK